MTSFSNAFVVLAVSTYTSVCSIFNVYCVLSKLELAQMVQITLRACKVFSMVGNS